jgi:hypothetical protein
MRPIDLGFYREQCYVAFMAFSSSPLMAALEVVPAILCLAVGNLHWYSNARGNVADFSLVLYPSGTSTLLLAVYSVARPHGAIATFLILNTFANYAKLKEGCEA